MIKQLICERIRMGYSCHSYLPNGCEHCGRGSPKRPLLEQLKQLINNLTKKEN